MKNKSVSVLLALLLLPILANVVQGSTAYVSPSTYAIHQVKNSSGESLLEYDYGTWRPHDDAYLKGYAQSGGYNWVYVHLSTLGGSSTKKHATYGETIYLVAEVGGQDHATYARGEAFSRAGNIYMRVQ